MKISTRARYGTRAMLDLALHQNGEPVLVKDIAGRQQISRQYLEQLLLALKLAGLVRSVRGAGGGFVLARPPGQIRISEIVQVLEGPLCPVDCVDNPTFYSRSDRCATRDIWCRVKGAVLGVLEGITLDELAQQQQDMDERREERLS